MPASVVVAALTEPTEAQGAWPLTSDASTSSCATARTPTVMSDQLVARRIDRCELAPLHTKADTRSTPTAVMMPTYDANLSSQRTADGVDDTRSSSTCSVDAAGAVATDREPAPGAAVAGGALAAGAIRAGAPVAGAGAAGATSIAKSTRPVMG